MPAGLKRYQQAHTLHYVTFTCHHRAPYLETARAREVFECTLERVRRWYGFYVNAYGSCWSHEKFLEKLHYIHHNPVRRGLVARPEDWKWSSFPHITTGEDSVVEVESQWTARKRERLGILPVVKIRTA